MCTNITDCHIQTVLGCSEIHVYHGYMIVHVQVYMSIYRLGLGATCTCTRIHVGLSMSVCLEHPRLSLELLRQCRLPVETASSC